MGWKERAEVAQDHGFCLSYRPWLQTLSNAINLQVFLSILILPLPPVQLYSRQKQISWVICQLKSCGIHFLITLIFCRYRYFQQRQLKKIQILNLFLMLACLGYTSISLKSKVSLKYTRTQEGWEIKLWENGIQLAGITCISELY